MRCGGWRPPFLQRRRCSPLVDEQPGVIALIMELVHGETVQGFMRGRCASRELPREEAHLQVVLGTCCSLLYLHSRWTRVLHGDLKITNDMVETVVGGFRATKDQLKRVYDPGMRELWLIEVLLTPGHVLGQGGFGTVAGGAYCGVPVAVKVPIGRVELLGQAGLALHVPHGGRAL